MLKKTKSLIVFKQILLVLFFKQSFCLQQSILDNHTLFIDCEDSFKLAQDEINFPQASETYFEYEKKQFKLIFLDKPVSTEKSIDRYNLLPSDCIHQINFHVLLHALSTDQTKKDPYIYSPKLTKAREDAKTILENYPKLLNESEMLNKKAKELEKQKLITQSLIAEIATLKQKKINDQKTLETLKLDLKKRIALQLSEIQDYEKKFSIVDEKIKKETLSEDILNLFNLYIKYNDLINQFKNREFEVVKQSTSSEKASDNQHDTSDNNWTIGSRSKKKSLK